MFMRSDFVPTVFFQNCNKFKIHPNQRNRTDTYTKRGNSIIYHLLNRNSCKVPRNVQYFHA